MGREEKKGEREQRLYRSTLPPRETRDPLGFFKNRKKNSSRVRTKWEKMWNCRNPDCPNEMEFFWGVGEWDWRKSGMKLKLLYWGQQGANKARSTWKRKSRRERKPHMGQTKRRDVYERVGNQSYHNNDSRVPYPWWKPDEDGIIVSDGWGCGWWGCGINERKRN